MYVFVTVCVNLCDFVCVCNREGERESMCLCVHALAK